MALKIVAGDDVKRGDFFFVDPFQISVKEDLRGRCKPIAQEAIVAMAISFHENGQIQPVQCRRVEGNKLQLNLGFTRTNAARLLRDGFECDGENYHDPDFKLKVAVVDCNDQQAFINNIVENAQRNETSDVDDAINQERLRDRYGNSDAEIARLYGYPNQNKVGRLRKLLQLDQKILDMVHDGQLPTQAALELLDVPAVHREQIIAEAETTAAGKVKATSVRSVVRDHHLNDDNKPEDSGDTTTAETESTKKRPRTMREIRKWLEAWADGEDADLASFAKSLLKFAEGKIGEAAMDRAMARILHAIPANEPEESEAA